MRWNHRYIHGFILVYSITSHRSFERVEAYYQDVVRTKGGAPKFILVGNKVDKLNQREVSSEEGYGFARRLGCRFFETSAKTRVNVEEAFSSLVRTLRDPEATKPETPTGMASRGGVRGKGEKETRKRWQNRCIVF
jgi:GTPase SAR1 family protein